MARHTRKGRNPGPVDEWLDSLGYYRKNVAYDETCLFRSVSEQLFSCQLFHETVRKACIDYGRTNHVEFADLMPDKNDWDLYLDRLTKHMAVCGKIEIQMISKTYKRGILVFEGLNRSVRKASYDYGPSEDLLLCHMGEDHFDVVYKKEFIQDAGFCQSIIYRILYEDVFKINNVPEIVDTMLYQKTPAANGIFSQEENVEEQNKAETDLMVVPTLKLKNLSLLTQLDENFNEYEYLLRTNVAPFPFKIAKALDPTIYRNIEYDTWTEMRKEMRLGEWYYGDNNLVKGSACILKEHSGEELHCYIQEIFKERNECLIYITSLAEKRTVSFGQLKPEDDAKPWPVPYRFTKNLVVNVPKVESILERRYRKKKEKKRTISKGSNEECEPSEETNDFIRMLKGAPLLIKTEPVTESSPVNNGIKFEEDIAVNNNISLKYDSDKNCVLEEIPNTVNEIKNESMAWPQIPQLSLQMNQFSQNLTPPIENYLDQQQYYYPSDYPQYSVWTNGDYAAPMSQQNISLPLTPQPFEYPQTPDVVNFLFNDMCYSPNVTPNYSQQQVEMYPQVYAQSPAPLTPILLTTPEVNDYLLPSPIQPPQQLSVFSPTIRMPYVQMSPFVYPPTPSPSWYMTGVNSQGFIFPVVNNQNN